MEEISEKYFLGEDGMYQNTKIPKNGGVYFIFDNEEIIYIGRSNNLRLRLANHRTNTFYKQSWKVSFVIIDEENKRREAERFCIKKYKPRLNGKLYNGSYFAALLRNV